MSLIQFFLKQLNEESVTTRKILSRVPNDKYDWTPHVKSMDVRRLATHIAELPTWITMALTTEELDFENNNYESTFVDTTDQLMELFKRSLTDGRSQLIAEKASLMKNGPYAVVIPFIAYAPKAKSSAWRYRRSSTTGHN